MRDLEINKRTIYARNYIGVEEIKDEDDPTLYTGEKKVKYGAKYPIRTNISGARGQAEVELFGTDIAYDKTIVLDINKFNALKITENTVLFVNSKDKDKYDYKIVKIADTINTVVIAIKRVKN